MVPIPSHTRNILLVEDREQYYAPVKRWLVEDGFQVTLEKSFQEAAVALDTGHYHLVIVDIHLSQKVEDDDQGMWFLAEIEKRQLKEVMPCIVLTAHRNLEHVLAALQEHRVARYILKRPGYHTELLSTVHDIFKKKLGINFDLIYDGNSHQLISEIANRIHGSRDLPLSTATLIPQLWDLAGKLFVKAKRLHIALMEPGLTGAVIVRAQPTWKYGLGPSYVIKIGQRDKVEKEEANYENYVKPYLPANTTTRVDTVYTRNLGALLYTLAQSEADYPLMFDQLYRYQSPEITIAALHDLFHNTCRYWYDHRERHIEDLPALYHQAFQFDLSKLTGQVQTLLPGFDLTRKTFRPDETTPEVVNPIAWLTNHRAECTLPVFHSVTHGDLTGRNIIVAAPDRCWLIDFYRTENSHILRDFVVLETDIKFRLLPTLETQTFRSLEQKLLLEEHLVDGAAYFGTVLGPEARKAASVIASLRREAHVFARGTGRFHEARKEYLISLLMATLNVTRLPHIEPARKLHAMFSAGMLCAELDRLAGREPLN